MPNHCLVVSCNSRGRKRYGWRISFYRMPAVKKTNGAIHSLRQERRRKWIEALKRNDLTESSINNGRICSRHFITGKPASLLATNHPDWVPCVLMGKNPESIDSHDESFNDILNVQKKDISRKRKYAATDFLNIEQDRKISGKRKNETQETTQCQNETSNNPEKERACIESSMPKNKKEPLEIVLKENEKQMDLPKSIKPGEFRNLLTSTLNAFKIMSKKVDAQKCQNHVLESEVGVRSDGNQNELLKKMLTLENSVKDMNDMLIESLIITDNDLKHAQKENMSTEFYSLKQENISLKTEREKLNQMIAKLEEQLEVKEKAFQEQLYTIKIYNPGDTPTILFVTDDN